MKNPANPKRLSELNSEEWGYAGARKKLQFRVPSCVTQHGTSILCRETNESEGGGGGWVSEVAVFLFVFHSSDHVNSALRSWVTRSCLKKPSLSHTDSITSSPEVQLVLPHPPTHYRLVLIHTNTHRVVGEWRHQIFHKDAASVFKTTQEEEKKKRKKSLR